MARENSPNKQIGRGFVNGENDWDSDSGSARGMNSNLNLLDGIIQCVVQSKTNTPGTETDGYMYLVGDSPTGAWSSFTENNIAYWDDAASAWVEIETQTGWLVWNVATSQVVIVGYSPPVAREGGVVDDASSSVATLDATLSKLWRVTLAAAWSPSFLWRGTDRDRIILAIKQDTVGSGFTVSFPGEVKWAGGSTPALTAAAGAVDTFEFWTPDGGTTVYGQLTGADVK